MKLRWADAAADDLERIADYLFENTPHHAARLVGVIYDAPQKLLTFPWIGKPGRAAGTRELVVSGLPYLVIYRVDADLIHVARILHGAQRWP